MLPLSFAAGESSSAPAGPELEIIVGDVVIRAATGTDEGLLIRAARTAAP